MHTDSRPVLADRADAHAADAEAILAVIADVQAGMNGNDAQLAVRHFGSGGRVT